MGGGGEAFIRGGFKHGCIFLFAYRYMGEYLWSGGLGACGGGGGRGAYRQ